MIETNPSIYSMFIVMRQDGTPAGVCPTVIDATAFAKCIGYDAPMDAIKQVPVVEFVRNGGVR